MAWHLAYPNVFAYEGEIYMITDGWSNLNLYKATEFPLKWKLLKNLHDTHYIDPTIVEYEGVWWMFVNVEQENFFHLHILFSDSPLGPWSDHPNNCVIKSYNVTTEQPSDHTCHGGFRVKTHHKTGPLRRGQVGIRSGGRAFVHKGRLYRMVQHSRKVYGDDLDMYEVIHISKTKPVQEVLVPQFNANYRKPENIGKWNAGRYHHIDMHQVRDNSGAPMWVAFVDGNPDDNKPSMDESSEQKAWYNQHCTGDARAQTMERARLRDVTVSGAGIGAGSGGDKVLVPTVPAATYGADADLALVRDQRRVHVTSEGNARPWEKSPWAEEEYAALDDPTVPPVYAGFKANSLCFVHAASSSHYHESLAFIRSVRQQYPCHPLYVYDLGFTATEIKVIQMYGNVHILPLNISRPFFEFKACVFKAPMLQDFMRRYDRGEHSCKLAYYGDAHTLMVYKFNKAAYSELRANGIVAEVPTRYAQFQYTHPDMFPWFGYDREEEVRQWRGRNGFTQVQAGLLLFDVTNMTVRNNLFNPWAQCCLQAACLSPNNYETHMAGRKPLQILPLADGSYVMKTHRDDQSAFTFLVDRLFGRGKMSLRHKFLNDYVYAYWRSAITPGEAIAFTKNKTNYASCAANYNN